MSIHNDFHDYEDIIITPSYLDKAMEEFRQKVDNIASEEAKSVLNEYKEAKHELRAVEREILRKKKEIEKLSDEIKTMENKEQTLPKCGKCGGEARYNKALAFSNSLWYVQCTKCHLRTPTYTKKEDALEAWFKDKPKKNDFRADALVLYDLFYTKNGFATDKPKAEEVVTEKELRLLKKHDCKVTVFSTDENLLLHEGELYKAFKANGICTGCSFATVFQCAGRSCMIYSRKDNRNIIWKQID